MCLEHFLLYTIVITTYLTAYICFEIINTCIIYHYNVRPRKHFFIHVVFHLYIQNLNPEPLTSVPFSYFIPHILPHIPLQYRPTLRMVYPAGKYYVLGPTTLKAHVVPRPTLHNVIFHTILDDFLNTRVLSSHF